MLLNTVAMIVTVIALIVASLQLIFDIYQHFDEKQDEDDDENKS